MDRIATLQSLLQQEKLEGMVLNAGPSLTYFTGLHFHVMERPVVLIVPADSTPCLVLPGLEEQKLEGVDFPLRHFCYGDDPALWSETFGLALKEAGLLSGCLGLEPRQMRVLEQTYITQGAPALSFRDGASLIARLRQIKDERELAWHRRAVEVAEVALTGTLPMIFPGTTEKEIAAQLFCNLLRAGSDSCLPFDPIVAAGPNAANPHATPTDRPLQRGDLLIIDWGASINGYVSDLTRTFGIVEVGEQEREICSAVLAANRAGREAGRPGIQCGDVDRATRAVIETAGFGEFFTHRTGHGFGLECHEEPYIHSASETLLAPGMTYTVEPGIYLPGRNGVRIEDDVVVTENGTESLSTIGRGLVLLGENRGVHGR